MRTPENSPRKAPQTPVGKNTLRQTTVSFKPVPFTPKRSKTPPPVTHPISPPDTPLQAKKLNPNDPVYIQEYARILKENHIAAPLFDSDTSAAEKILLHFDMSSEYGPAVGMSRLERWQRADNLDLEPPVIVYKILSATSDSKFTEPFSHGRQ